MAEVTKTAQTIQISDGTTAEITTISNDHMTTEQWDYSGLVEGHEIRHGSVNPTDPSFTFTSVNHVHLVGQETGDSVNGLYILHQSGEDGGRSGVAHGTYFIDGVKESIKSEVSYPHQSNVIIQTDTTIQHFHDDLSI